MKAVREYILIVLGSVLAALGIDLFLSPNKIAPGGASGLAIVLYNVIGIPVSVGVIGVNIVLFAIGYKQLSGNSLFKTAIASILLSFFIEVFARFLPLSDDMLLCCAYGGLLVGLGTGTVIVNGASSGGSDFAAILIHRIVPHISVAKLILAVDFGVVLVSGIVFKDYTVMLYAIVSLFVASKAAEFVIEGLNFSKLVYIISDKNNEIVSYIKYELRRGITSFKAKGEYSGHERTVLMCAVSPNQFPNLKSYIRSVDKNAFIILSDARSVFGEGFNIE